MFLAFGLLCVLVALPVTGSVVYLLFLLCAAAIGKRTVQRAPVGNTLRFAVIVPAHNEELVLQTTLDSLHAQMFPANQVEVVVVADNCEDTTARIALAAGATVLERFHATEKGKGYALAFAVEQLLAGPRPADAFVIVDADTWVAPNFLSVMDSYLRNHTNSANGFCAVQGRYGVLNADEGWRAALMAGAFDLFNHIKPLGRDQLGFSVGLKGNGMAFTRAILEAAPWQGRSITEDIDYGLDLLRHHSVRVGYAPHALVKAQMPTTAKQAASQRERWEGGRWNLVRERAVPLLLEGLKAHDLRRVDAALDLLLPPLSELAGLLAVWAMLVIAGAILHLLPGGTLLWSVCLGTVTIGFVAYILFGFAVAGAGREAYFALLKAPGYAMWKFALYALQLIRKKGRKTNTAEWVRTERAAIPVATVEDKAA